VRLRSLVATAVPLVSADGGLLAAFLLLGLVLEAVTDMRSHPLLGIDDHPGRWLA